MPAGHEFIAPLLGRRMQVALGFLLTSISVRAVAAVGEHWGWRWAGPRHDGGAAARHPGHGAAQDGAVD